MIHSYIIKIHHFIVDYILSHSDKSYAAIDLGSNSFHMMIANYTDDRIIVVDRLKEMVRLAFGLSENKHLNEDSMQIALQCLEKFAQRTKNIPITNIRAVGTNTLRQAKNGNDFLVRANACLEHDIEIISGREEARLIYLGVANTIFNDKDQRLIIDIGGGSTEFIIGQGYDAKITESLYMGCVNISQRFFKDGNISLNSINKARMASLQELENIRKQYNSHGWDMVIGTSGSIRAVLDVVEEENLGTTVITAKSISKIIKSLIKFGHIEKINFASLSANRKPVFIGGIIILSAIFEALNIKEMEYSYGALREGLLYDLIGRQNDKDIREQTVELLMSSYNVDKAYSHNLINTVKNIFDKTEKPWKLDKNKDLKMIIWAAKLNEIGLAISHSQYHKHGAYIVSNSDMLGFSRQEQYIISVLIRSHRRKFPIDIFNSISSQKLKEKLIKMAIVLRLAVVLNRGKNLSELPVNVIVDNKNILLKFKNEWLSSKPLTEDNLKTEAYLLEITGYKLNYS